MAENQNQDNPKPKKPKDPADSPPGSVFAAAQRKAQAEADAYHAARAKIAAAKKGAMETAIDAVERDVDWEVTYNEFNCRFFVNGAPLEKEIHAIDLMVQLQRIEKLKKIGKDTCYDVLKRVGRRHAFNPVVDEVRAYVWDGVARLDTFFETYFGAQAEPDYLQRVGAWFWIGHVGRLLDPGSRQDSMLTLEGGEGLGKTQFCRLLAVGNEFYRENLPELHYADAKEALIGKRVVEMSELVALTSARSQETFKAFASTPIDNVRLPYGERSQAHPRTATIIGTTNPTKYLSSAYGNRRIWGVGCHQINLPALERDLDQCFAEAVVRYDAGEKWWPDSQEQASFFAPEQERRLEDDPYADAIVSYLANEPIAAVKEDWTARELFDEVANKSRGAIEMKDWPRLARKTWPEAMRKAGLMPLVFPRTGEQKRSTAARGWGALWARERSGGSNDGLL